MLLHRYTARSHALRRLWPADEAAEFSQRPSARNCTKRPPASALPPPALVLKLQTSDRPDASDFIDEYTPTRVRLDEDLTGSVTCSRCRLPIYGCVFGARQQPFLHFGCATQLCSEQRHAAQRAHAKRQRRIEHTARFDRSRPKPVMRKHVDGTTRRSRRSTQHVAGVLDPPPCDGHTRRLSASVLGPQTFVCSNK